EQLKAGKPLTVTDVAMTRVIVSLEEAVVLVLYAFQHAVNGDIMVQKSPASYIHDLSQTLLELFEVNVPIEVIGTTHGEKIYEVLLTKEEASRAIDLGRFYRVPSANRNLNYDKYLHEGSPSIGM